MTKSKKTNTSKSKADKTVKAKTFGWESDIKDLEMKSFKEIEEIYKHMIELKDHINKVEKKLEKVAGRLGL